MMMRKIENVIEKLFTWLKIRIKIVSFMIGGKYQGPWPKHKTVQRSFHLSFLPQKKYERWTFLNANLPKMKFKWKWSYQKGRKVKLTFTKCLPYIATTKSFTTSSSPSHHYNMRTSKSQDLCSTNRLVFHSLYPP
jgi:hypothetical protein